METEVKTTETSTVEPEVKQEVNQESVQAETSEQPQETTPKVQDAPSAAQPNVDLYDDRGVPWRNVAMEHKRKLEELSERLPELIEQGFQKYGTKAQEREYTISELESYALENPQHRPWVEEQKAKLLLKNVQKELDTKLQADKKQKEAETKKQQALQYVMANYSEAFVRNPQGQIVSWDNNHPLTAQIGQLMRDPRFANDPEGLVAAADIAYARLARQNQGAHIQKEKALKDEIKSIQKGTLIEGGGKASSQVLPKTRAAIDKLKQTGSVKDAVEAIAAINSLRRSQRESEE